MSTAREAIFRRIRQSLGRTDRGAPPPSSWRAALESDVRPRLDREPVDNFVHKLESVSGTVQRIDSSSSLIDALAEHLDRHRLGTRLSAAEYPVLAGIEWPAEWEIHTGPARGDDRVSVTGAFAGVAETGTVVILSSPESPTTLNFLPDDHIVVLRSEQIVAHLEDVWQRLREHTPGLPRTVNLITGPSRTADVEQTIQLGAHGPRRFHVILIEA